MNLDFSTATAGQLTLALRSRQISSRELLDQLLGTPPRWAVVAGS